MSTRTGLSDRMKMYERREAGRQCMPRLPICARIDGKNFSSFTRALPRPFDARLSQLMIQTTAFLVEKTGARIGYTQSDEISLIFHAAGENSLIYLGGRLQKLTSILASMATAAFNAGLAAAIPEKAGQVAFFDCRVWDVPSLEEAANVILWRSLDATKNSISMAARAKFSHNALHRKSGREMRAMLQEVGVDWDAYPAYFKRGTFLQRRTITRTFTAAERAALPPRHAAHQDPDLVVTRSEIQQIDMPPFLDVINRVGVIFHGEAPLTDDDVVYREE